MQELSPGTCARAVRAFAPLEEDVRRQMVSLTTAFNEWLGDAPEELSEKALMGIEEHLKVLDGASYLSHCYRWAGGTGGADVRVKFLLSLAMVLRALFGSAKAKAAEELTERAERLLLRFFGGKEESQAEGSLQRTRERCFSWLEGRLLRYDRQWRRCTERAKALGFAGELRRRLGRAVEASSGAEWLNLPHWPMAYCSVAKALAGFVVEYFDEKRFLELPEHSLQPAALLHVLNELLDPFEVEETYGAEGGVRLNEAWEAIKAEQDTPPPVRQEAPKALTPRASTRPVQAQPSNSNDTPKDTVSSREPQPQKPQPSPEPLEAKEAKDAKEAKKRSRSRSSSGESLQPKLLKARKKEPKEPKDGEDGKVANDVQKEDSKDVEKEAVESKPVETASPSPKKAKKRSNSSTSEQAPKQAVAKKAAAASPHPPPSHGSPGQYFYPMHWGPMAIPMMPHPGHRPGLPMMPHYLMPGMPMAVEKKKKDKRKEKHRKEKDRDKDRGDSGSESSHEKKRRKKKEKAAKKEKKEKSK